MFEPLRQIHLDFHTSEHIEGIGGRFRKEQFQEALKLGRVELINVFAKCHHGWSYYPTEVGNPHPHLTCDLLGGQIEACHEIGVKAPIYYTMGWSVHDAETHPEWCMRTLDGELVTMNVNPTAQPDDPRPTCSWVCLCPSGAYNELMLAQTDEICRRYPVDGFWYDIYLAPRNCWCETCRKAMRDSGLDPNRSGDVQLQRARTLAAHMEGITKVIHGRHPDASIYFNGLTHIPHPGAATGRLFDYNTKNDLEDLPTTWGGYDKLPMRAKYFHKQGKAIVAMSGKFHTSWGEFGGFKHPDALRYEAASMLAFGVRCNFGDQLHPEGEMDLDTYRNLGQAFSYVETMGEYGVEAKPVASLGVWPSGSGAHDEGTSVMLLEQQIDFDVVVEDEPLERYEAIVLPSATVLSDQQAARLNAYAASGGGVLALGASALDASRTRIVLDIGADYVGTGSYDVDYLVVGDAVAAELVCSPFLNYAAGLRVQPHAETEVLATVHEPYFSRTYARYCSHQNTPYRMKPAAQPGMLRKGNIIWSAHELDEMYKMHGARVHRQLFINALSLLHRRPMVEAGLPSAGRVSLLHQPDKSRYVLHLLYSPALPRGRCKVIEDLVPLHDVPIRLRLPRQVLRIKQMPENRELPFTVDGNGLSLTVPSFTCHSALVLETER